MKTTWIRLQLQKMCSDDLQLFMNYNRGVLWKIRNFVAKTSMYESF